MFSLLNQVPPGHWKNSPRTPLHIASLRNRSDLIDQLIDYGIDINQRSTERSPYCVIYILGTTTMLYTALHAAVCNRDVDAVSKLLRRGADKTIKDSNKCIPMDIAMDADRSGVGNEEHIAQMKQIIKLLSD